MVNPFLRSTKNHILSMITIFLIDEWVDLVWDVAVHNHAMVHLRSSSFIESQPSFSSWWPQDDRQIPLLLSSWAPPEVQPGQPTTVLLDAFSNSQAAWKGLRWMIMTKPFSSWSTRCHSATTGMLLQRFGVPLFCTWTCHVHRPQCTLTFWGQHPDTKLIGWTTSTN